MKAILAIWLVVFSLEASAAAAQSATSAKVDRSAIRANCHKQFRSQHFHRDFAAANRVMMKCMEEGQRKARGGPLNGR